MPFYHYFCESNRETVEVRHGMTERLKTWGEVCDCTGVNPGETSRLAPVIRLISKPVTVSWGLKGLDKDEPSDKLSF